MEGDCANCQARWNGNARFCSNCGSSLHRQYPETSPRPVPPLQALPGALPDTATPRSYRMAEMPVAYPTMQQGHGMSHPGYPPVHPYPETSPRPVPPLQALPGALPDNATPRSYRMAEMPVAYPTMQQGHGMSHPVYPPMVAGMTPRGGLVVTGVPARDPWLTRWQQIGPGVGGTTTYVVEMRNEGGLSPEVADNPTCARIGCLFSWIPIVGFVTYCVNYHAPEGSMQRRFARAAMATSIVSLTFLIVMQLFVTPQGSHQSPSQRTNP